jgi:hypothetical protein
MSRFSPVPIFGFYEDSIGPDLAVGGWVVSGTEMGLIAGELSLKLLSGTNSNSSYFPIYNDNGQYMFSRTQLNKWQIVLPEDIQSNAIFVEDRDTLWQFDCTKFNDSICY